MKKILTILVVLTLVVGAAFADTNDQLKLESKVAKVVPTLQIKDGGEGVASGVAKVSTNVGDSSGSKTISTTRDISEQAIVWKFEIWQNGGKDVNNNNATVADYAKYYQPITISLTLEKFKCGSNEEKDAPSITTVTPGANVTGKLTLTEDTGKTLKADYKGKVSNQLLGTFTCTWPQDDTLPDGTYTATVKMT